MTYITAVFLGLIQGVAEFLPISSSGHLALLQNFLGLTDVGREHVFFDVLLHFGTFISVCIVYRWEVVDMIYEFFAGVGDLFSRGGRRAPVPPPARRLVFLIIVGTLPLFLILPFKDSVEGLYSNPLFIGCALMATGLILFYADRMARGRKTERNATVADALIIGLAQAVAVIPGLSRSGTTISVGMLRGMDRSFAVRYSFLLSLPAVLGANILSLVNAVRAGFDTALLPMYLAGTLVAMVSGCFAIGLVKSLARRGRFGGFAYYCWLVGAVAIAASVLTG